MTILFDACRPVKPNTSRRFAAGLVRSLPTTREPYTAADLAWLAEDNARRAAEDRCLDAMAIEAEQLDRASRGPVL